MSFVVVGLGNPDKEYEKTRHNVGRMIVGSFSELPGFEELKEDKKLNSFVSQGSIGKIKVKLLLPNTYMNRSGIAVKKLITNQAKAKKLLIVYDDIDLPLGSFKIAFGRSSGGHKGVESIIKLVNTKNFIRIRIGVAPINLKGEIKKPKGEKKVLDFLMSPFQNKEEQIFKRVVKKVHVVLETIIANGYVKAMNEFN